MNERSDTQAALTAVEYYLPDAVLTNEDISQGAPDWDPAKILAKTGIRQRHTAAPEQTAGDLAFVAARRLFDSSACRPEDVDLLVLCTQTPDYALPTTACHLQHRLGIPTTCAAFDFNLGCSGFVYGLGIVKGMVEAGLAHKAILITSETYSKWLAPDDRGTRTIFGDGAAASLVEAVPSPRGQEFIGPFVFGTDGKGFDRLIVHGSGARTTPPPEAKPLPTGHPPDRLYMDGPEIFAFTIRTVPDNVQRLLGKAGMAVGDFDLFVFHQANAYMMEHLRKRMSIPPERFVVDLEESGNTVSSTIPIALANAVRAGRLHEGMSVAIVGFGVGYSWASARIVWQGRSAQEPLARGANG